jgi:hypothetical protein
MDDGSYQASDSPDHASFATASALTEIIVT